MALNSKHTMVLADSPSFKESKLSLSSLSSAVSSPLLSYSASSLSHSPSSTSISRRKVFPSNIEKGDWPDAMKASSPLDIKLIKESNLEEAGLDMVDATYGPWITNHPSALNMFEQMMNPAKGKRIVVFLDYDGTLSPIVDDPEQAHMSDAMRSTVREVARYFPTAIISGRCRDKVYDFVQLAEIYYAGSHGMDIMAPTRGFTGSKNGYTKATDKTGNEVVLFQPAREFLPMIDEVFKLLKEKTKRIPGAMVENNKFCVSVHFRRVEEKNWSALAEQVRSVLREYPRLCLTQGRKVLEIRPSIKWDKGNALEFLLEALGLANCNDVMPLYIGDDRSDEDAFKVLHARGQGYPILVSSVPKETKASYSLRDPSECVCT
eukprot:Gb_34064 [translate_table: standard]